MNFPLLQTTAVSGLMKLIFRLYYSFRQFLINCKVAGVLAESKCRFRFRRNVMAMRIEGCPFVKRPIYLLLFE